MGLEDSTRIAYDLGLNKWFRSGGQTGLADWILPPSSHDMVTLKFSHPRFMYQRRQRLRETVCLPDDIVAAISVAS